MADQQPPHASDRQVRPGQPVKTTHDQTASRAPEAPVTDEAPGAAAARSSSGPLPHITRVYYERDALAWPDASTVLGRLSHLPAVEVDHYKDIFNRPGQHFQIQKHAPALILAVERDRLLYDGSTRVASWNGTVPLYYNAPVRNCVFNCDYCFLQGMHNSGHIVLFVNSPDFMQKAAERANEGPIFLSISYLTDLPAFEKLLPICRQWIEFAESTPGLEIELRTKSEYFVAIRDIPAPKQTVLSFSLSPPSVAARYERGCASFAGRLFAARQAQVAGWRIRLCFDPIIRVDDWRREYRECIRETFRRLDPEKIEEISFGVVRLAPDFLSRIRAGRSDSDMLYYPFRHEKGADGSTVATYPVEQR
ncbi:MAG: radical SAM protein, partial [Spirochaetota bacterium]